MTDDSNAATQVWMFKSKTALSSMLIIGSHQCSNVADFAVIPKEMKLDVNP
jgi:hypothetical protein